jgi:PKHD-type hydroxylase
VTPVTPVTCVCAFFWVQSLVCDEVRRSILFDLDTSLQALGRDVPDHPELVQLTGHYPNLLRQWAEL